MEGVNRVPREVAPVAAQAEGESSADGDRRPVSIPHGPSRELPPVQDPADNAQNSKLKFRDLVEVGEVGSSGLCVLGTVADCGMSGGGSGIAQAFTWGLEEAVVIGEMIVSKLTSQKEVTICQDLNQPGILDQPMPNLIESSREYIRGINDLALDILKNPDRMKGFAHGNDILGKKAALKQLKECLGSFDFLTENLQGNEREQMLLVKQDIETATKFVGQKLRKARIKKAASYTAVALSTTATIAGCVVTGGVALAPEIIRTATSTVASGCEVASLKLAKAKDGYAINQSEGILEGSRAELDNRGISIPGPKLRTLRAYNNLALDILKQPEKNKNFCFKGRLLGKKEAKRALKLASKDFVTLIGGVESQEALEELRKVKKDFEAALQIVSKKLRKARGKKGAEIAGSILALTAAVAGTVVTFGCGSPITIPAAISAVTGLVGTTIGAIRTAIKIERSAAEGTENFDVDAAYLASVAREINSLPFA